MAMKKFTIEIEIDRPYLAIDFKREAFQTGQEHLEIVRILDKEVIARIMNLVHHTTYGLDGVKSFALRDINRVITGKAQFHYGRE